MPICAAALDACALFGLYLGEIPVERERLIAMVEDDQAAVPGERVGVGDRSVVYGADERALAAASISTPRIGGRPDADRAEPLPDRFRRSATCRSPLKGASGSGTAPAWSETGE